MSLLLRSKAGAVSVSDIIIYTTDDGATRIDLQLESGTVWLSQRQIAELDERATVNQQLTVQIGGRREVSRSITLHDLVSAGRKLLDNAGKISHEQAQSKVKHEYQAYKAKTLASVERDYLKTLATLENQAKKESRKK